MLTNLLQVSIGRDFGALKGLTPSQLEIRFFIISLEVSIDGIFTFAAQFGQRLDEMEEMLTDNRIWQKIFIGRDFGALKELTPSQLEILFFHKFTSS